jgi:hypothetical protein
VEKQRLIADKSGGELALLREREQLIDPDPEALNSTISVPEGATNPNAVADYVKAKSQFLQDKRIYEHALIKLSIDMLEKGIDFDRQLSAKKPFQPKRRRQAPGDAGSVHSSLKS